jgi:hypothetical protein
MAAFRLSVFPSHTGELELAVGAAGAGFTVTEYVPALPVHPFCVAVTEYIPAFAAAAFEIATTCVFAVKPFGPVQLYEVPTVLAVKLILDPAHTGLLPVITGAAGTALTVTLTVAEGLVHPPTVTVTEYVPLSAALAFETDGFWVEAVHMFGPVQLYVAPAIVFEVRFIDEPLQTGLLLPAVGAAGAGFTVTVTVAFAEQPFALVPVTE